MKKFHTIFAVSVSCSTISAWGQRPSFARYVRRLYIEILLSRHFYERGTVTLVVPCVLNISGFYALSCLQKIVQTSEHEKFVSNKRRYIGTGS